MDLIRHVSPKKMSPWETVGFFWQPKLSPSKVLDNRQATLSGGCFPANQMSLVSILTTTKNKPEKSNLIYFQINSQTESKKNTTTLNPKMHASNSFPNLILCMAFLSLHFFILVVFDSFIHHPSPFCHARPWRCTGHHGDAGGGAAGQPPGG